MSRIDDLEGLDLAVYSATWCPDCRRLEAWLAGHGVAHQKVDIETEPGAAEKLEAETGQAGHSVRAGERGALGPGLSQGIAPAAGRGPAGGGTGGGGEITRPGHAP